MKIKTIIIFVLVIGIAIGVYKYLTQDKRPSYDSVVVKKGSISQKVSITGQVIPAKTINLQFEIQGTIAVIKTEEGQEVDTGELLAVLDTSELTTQLQEAEAARDVAQAQLNQVLSGAALEEIKVYETSQENAQIALKSAQTILINAQQNLVDVEAIAQENLSQAYNNALDILDDAYLKAYNASNAVVSIFRNYFDTSSLIKEDKESIENIVSQMEDLLANVETSPTNKNADQALQDCGKYLVDISQDLEHIRTTVEQPDYFWRLPATEKTNLDNQILYVNTAATNVMAARQVISSTRLTNESNINTAKASVDASQNQVYEAEGTLKSAKEKLAQIKAPAQQVDIDLAEAQLEQFEAALSRVRQKLTRTKLIAPCQGIVIDLKSQEGELVMSMIKDPVVTLMCKGKFQIEADIPEVNVANIDLQDRAEIIFDAFPEQKFSGMVVEINPAETIIQGVVYYKTTLELTEEVDKIKSGMTANVEIIAETRQDVLTVPQRAVFVKNGQKFVRVLEGQNVKEVTVETGLRGSEGEVEIMSGLKQGDRVVTFIKEK